MTRELLYHHKNGAVVLKETDEKGRTHHEILVRLVYGDEKLNALLVQTVREEYVRRGVLTE